MRHCLFLFLLLAACRPESPPQLSFYHWKGEPAFDTADSVQAAQMGAGRLYVRFFDVAWDSAYRGPAPRSVLRGESADLHFGGEYVPVVFLTNECFLRADSAGCAVLAQKLAAKILAMQSEPFARLRYANEIQLDCDWTPKSRDRYFYFLQKIKNHLPGRALTCTVRMHQYRDRDPNGVPPVERGLLMCYNVAPVEAYDTHNAIFDPALISGYLKAAPYPIPLDIGLPIFRWGVQFRDEAFEAVLNPAPTDTALLRREEGLWHRVLRDTVFQGKLLRKGDQIRIEHADIEALTQVARLLRKKNNLGAKQIILYHWDKNLLQHYAPSQVIALHSCFF